MSIFRQPFERHDWKGGLDSALVYHLLHKYGDVAQTWLEPFPGGEIAEEIMTQLGMFHATIDFVGGDDARELPYPDGGMSGVLFHSPYWKAIKYSDDPRDLSNCKSYEGFITELSKCLDEAERVLDARGWLIVIVGDVRKDTILYPVHSDVIQHMKTKGNLVYRDMMIWELSATGTPFLSTKWMIMGNYCMIWEKLGEDLERVFG